MIPLLSICIPSYNRPSQLFNLLMSIDCDPRDIEVIVSEDCSPERVHIRSEVKTFQEQTDYNVSYYENQTNLGYDGNLRQLIELATGKFVLYMGDDDLFVPGALDQFLQFLTKHEDKKYILRSYIAVHPSGSVEKFRYLKKSTSFPCGEETVAWLFKRSVSIAGFTISRDEARSVATTDLDGTLLYQLYLMARICLEYESVYCDIPITQVTQTFREGSPNFGVSEAEKGRFTPGVISLDNSVNFTKGYFEVAQHIDKLFATNLTSRVKIELSKYSYPFLSIQRRRGIGPFLHYAKRLEKEIGLGCTRYFYFYKWGLVILGERLCDFMIIWMKKIFGATPNL